MSNHDLLISIIVPAYNEEELIEQFLSGVTTFFNHKLTNYELLLIENGSQDKTLQIAHIFSLSNHAVKIYHLPKPGYGSALIFGIKKAKGKYLIIYNVDYWDKKITEHLDNDNREWDILVGSKNLPESKDRRPITRRLVTKIFSKYLNIFFGYKGTDSHGIMVFNRKKIMPILKKCKAGAGLIDSELLIRSQRAGLSIHEYPVAVIEKRPNRFGFRRILQTPGDLFTLYTTLKK